MKPYLIAALDIGTSTIRLLTASKDIEKGDFEILEMKEISSSGVRKGAIVDPEELSKKLQLLILQSQIFNARKINSVFVNINGNRISSVFSHGLVSVSRADQKISQGDIDRVLQAAQTVSLPKNKEVLDVFPKDYIVDRENGIKDPLGMRGVRLEADVLLVCAFSPYFHNLTQAVLGSGIETEDILPSPLAAASAVLTPRQKELGVVIVDIGAATTGMAVFEENTLLNLAVFPIGSAHISNDIAIGLRTDIDTAERIKKDFGSCIASKGRKIHKIKIDSASKIKERLLKKKTSDRDFDLNFSQKMMTEIVEARVCEIFEQVQKELKKISRQGLLPAGVVLTGGGAKLPKIVELAKKELKLPCQIGVPRRFAGIKEDPSLATVCGLILEGDAPGGGKPLISAFWRNLSDKLKKVFRIFIP